jgi:hypothetical protein
MMTGDYTKVPLRADERWTGARMQQGRASLDHEWNLNIDAAARTVRGLAADVIGPAGVVAGSQDFEVSVAASVALDLNVHAGRIWVDGLLAYAPQNFDYTTQDQIEKLPQSGRALVYLDAWEQHVQPAEAPDALVDPALAPVDSAARTRIGYRVRCAPTTAGTCEEAWNGLNPVAGSTGTLSINRAAPAAPADPCAPPGDPLGRLPDGLFRVEVIDPGGGGDARFAWSFRNGSDAVSVSQIAGDLVTLRPSAAVAFATGDRVEVACLARREDRVPHGPLYTIVQSPQGNVLTLDRPVDPQVDAGADGLVVRRWDGEVVGATAAVSATLRGTDLGVRFKANPGDYVVGDAWCARVREAAGVGIELRVDASPDGVSHVFAPLALVDLNTRQVLQDCRPTFVPLTEIPPQASGGGGGACTVTAAPGDDLQAAVDALPPGGGELCLAAGLYKLAVSLRLLSRQRIVICGAGPATVLRATKTEAAVIVDDCTEIEIRHVTIDGGDPGIAMDPLNKGALTIVGSTKVTLSDCALTCPETQDGQSQTCVTVRSSPVRDSDAIRIERNRLGVGAWETGIRIDDIGHALVAGNEIGLGLPPAPVGPAPARSAGRGVRADGEPLARGLERAIKAAARPEAEPGTNPVTIPGAEPLHVVTGAQPEKLIAALAERLTLSEVERTGALEALLAAARRAAHGPDRLRLPEAAQGIIEEIAADVLVVGEGIVFSGVRAQTVQILDNLVEDTVVGITVDAAAPIAEGPTTDTVIIHRNVIHARVPAALEDDRYAVLVRNARSTHVVDTVATLLRTGIMKPPTDVDAIRIRGELGPFMVVRQSSLSGFAIGVNVLPTAPVPQPRTWLVAETMATDATAAVKDVTGVVDEERNYP